MTELKFEVQQTNGIIKVNFEELERQLSEKMQEFEGAIFTKDSKQIAKGELANLRKLRKDIEDSRKLVKTEWLKPYDEFKLRVDKLLGIVDKPIALIDKQLKEMEEIRIANKKVEIQALYTDLIGETEEFIPLEKIYDKKWENASVKMAAIEKEMIEIIESVETAVFTIRNMSSEAVPKALEMYKSDLSLANAITYINNYESQKLEILRKEEERKRQEEERKRQIEIDRIRAEERTRIAEEQKLREAVRKETVDELKTVDDNELKAYGYNNDTKRVIYTVVGTETELEEVEMALNSLGLYFERKDV